MAKKHAHWTGSPTTLWVAGIGWEGPPDPQNPVDSNVRSLNRDCLRTERTPTLLSFQTRKTEEMRRLWNFISFIFFVVSGAESRSKPLLSYTPLPTGPKTGHSTLHPIPSILASSNAFARFHLPVPSKDAPYTDPRPRPYPSPLGGVKTDGVRRLEARQVATGRRPPPPPPLRPKGRLNPRQRMSGYARHSPASPPTPWTAGKTQ